MDFQGRGIAGATVIGGDYRLGRVHYGGSMMAREIKYCEQLKLVVRWPGGQEIR